MMSGIHVDPAKMDELGRKTVNCSEQLEDQIKKIISNKNNLVEIWIGKSGTELDKAVQRQMENLTRFKDLIDTLGTKISTGSNTFYTNEEENAESAKSLYPDDFRSA